jgi:RNA polymerase sigma-70 factor (ECF subfamily)
VKDAPGCCIHPLVERALDDEVLSPAGEAAVNLSAIHAEHADFVWITLQRFGVPQVELEDAFQDVFIVVQRRIASFDWACPLTTWIFAVCRRVASTYRRRADRDRSRREPLDEEMTDPGGSPEELVVDRQAQARLDRMLDAMDLDRRAVFVMFEIEEMPCAEIAALIGVPVGTVYSRLYAARKELAKLLEKEQASAARRGER